MQEQQNQQQLFLCSLHAEVTTEQQPGLLARLSAVSLSPGTVLRERVVLAARLGGTTDMEVRFTRNLVEHGSRW